MSEKLKTRSAFFCRQMSDTVLAKLDVKATELGVAKWLLVEKILENSLGIAEDGIDVEKWLGVNRHSARVGKPYKKKATK